MRRFLATLFSLLLLGTPARAALSAASLGTHHSAGATTNVLTTVTNDCPIGSLIVLTAAYATIADTLSSVGDSAGNSWQTPFDNITETGIGIGWAYAINSTVDLPAGGTITATFGGSTVSTIGAVCIAGAATSTPKDISGQSSIGLASTSATTVNSGVLAQSSEILLGGLALSALTSAHTCNGSFTLGPDNASTAPDLAVCYQVVSSTSSVAFSPSWTSSANYVSDLVSFKGAAAATGSTLLPTLGVGN